MPTLRPSNPTGMAFVSERFFAAILGVATRRPTTDPTLNTLSDSRRYCNRTEKGRPGYFRPRQRPWLDRNDLIRIVEFSRRAPGGDRDWPSEKRHLVMQAGRPPNSTCSPSTSPRG